MLRILALEPYYGGSHRAFLDRWQTASSHGLTILGLPPHSWKWRMRHGALTLAEQVGERVAAGERWDRLWVSDMLDLATFRGLAPREVAVLPTLAYFHENQLTYPVREERERDLHFAFTNLTTALAADRVAFNSAFHRRELLDALTRQIPRWPDHQPKSAVATIEQKSCVVPQGVGPIPIRSGPRPSGPLRLVWVARWEHDKDPETFFAALGRLADAGVDFRLSVLGESFRQTPQVFAQAKQRFADRLERWGYLPTRGEYLAALAESDVVVSTAQHEFFGVAVVEAIAAGCYPCLPDRLAYPELLEPLGEQRRPFFYDGSVEALTGRLQALAHRVSEGDLWQGDPRRARRAIERFFWPRVAPRLDSLMEGLDQEARIREIQPRPGDETLL